MAEVEIGAKAVSLVFRIVVVALSVAGAVVMATANQICAGGVVVSYTKYGAFVYVVVAGVVSAVCSASALYLSVYKMTSPWVVSVLDVVTQGFLFSAAGAALAVRGVAPWSWGAGGADARSLCDVAGDFCGRVGTAATICACAAAAVSVAVLTKDARGGKSSSGGGGGGSSGCSCKHVGC